MALSGAFISISYGGSQSMAQDGWLLPGCLVWSETIPVTGGSAVGIVPVYGQNAGPLILDVYASVDGYLSYGPPPLSPSSPAIFVPAQLTYDFVVQPADAIMWMPA